MRGSRISHSWRYWTRSVTRVWPFAWNTDSHATSAAGFVETGAYQSRRPRMLPSVNVSGVSTAVIGTA
eukprot:850019-Pleurochrysis_carterae.AAC.1